MRYSHRSPDLSDNHTERMVVLGKRDKRLRDRELNKLFRTESEIRGAKRDLVSALRAACGLYDAVRFACSLVTNQSSR
jgi:hypothetical protein